MSAASARQVAEAARGLAAACASISGVVVVPPARAPLAETLLRAFPFEAATPRDILDLLEGLR